MGIFANKVSSSRRGHIYEIHGTDSSGTKAYYFVKVDDTNLPSFKSAVKTGSFELTDFGTVLAKGFGHKPPKSVRKNIY